MAGSGTGNDRVYVGENDFGAASGHTATIDLSLDAATAPAPAGFGTHSIETRATSGQDGPPIRPAVHLDGTVYGVYMGWRSATTTDVVVVRDDAWGAGATPFTALVKLGHARGQARGDRRLEVYVRQHARDPARRRGLVRDRGGSAEQLDRLHRLAGRDDGANQTLHVRRSTNRGVTWSAADIRTIANASNGALVRMSAALQVAPAFA